MAGKSMINEALDIVSANIEPISFKELWTKVCEAQGLNEQEARAMISKFYTSLCLDGRFIGLGDNTWTIRERVKIEQIKQVKDTDSFESNDEGSDEIDEDEISVNEDSNSKDEEGDEDSSSSDDENID